MARTALQYPVARSGGQICPTAELRGYRVGGAQVSEKHCGFIVNTGNATAQEIYELIKHVIRTVEEHAGVTLEPEVKFLGSFIES